MNYFHIYNNASFGVYQGETEEDAIRAFVTNANAGLEHVMNNDEISCDMLSERDLTIIKVLTRLYIQGYDDTAIELIDAHDVEEHEAMQRSKRPRKEANTEH